MTASMLIKVGGSGWGGCGCGEVVWLREKKVVVG